MKTVKVILLAVALFFVCYEVQASHNRAGEITFEWVVGHTYKFTVVTYTKKSSDADRCELEVDWGEASDNSDVDTLFRVNGDSGTICPSNVGAGEDIGNDIQLNIYIGYHTFPGPGIYTITMQDPNRNAGVVNMSDSFNTPFFLRTMLRIGSSVDGLDSNSSPSLLYPPIDDACAGKLFVHNASAFDPNGDSLSYVLVNCMDGETQPDLVIPGYYIPNSPAVNNVTIDPITGDLVWNLPPTVSGTTEHPNFDEYNICFEITEWRNGIPIGRVLRDMQVTVYSCQNNPPVIAQFEDTCVLAGSLFTETVTATDPDALDLITLTATGGPLVLTSNPATFTQDSIGNPTSGLFSWQTACSHVRNQPYFVTFKAEDNSSEVVLVDMKTVQITVISPAPLNPSATAVGNNINLTWDPSICSQATSYKIYRRFGQYPGTIDCPCETGVPASAGYTLIATIQGISNTSYTDNGGGMGLIHGNDYCYRITACFPDGAESCASVEVCDQLNRDVPIITHVSVGTTSNSAGVDTVRWSMPTELDTLSQWPWPYHYKIYRSPDYTTAATLISSTTVSNSLKLTDTTFIDVGLNTSGNPYSYKIELYSDTNLVGFTHTASSVFLSLASSDNQLTLSWQEDVPWNNTEYEIYKYNADSAWYLATTNSPSYADTGLINGKKYCYYIKSIGSYSISGIVNPIINFSQEECSTPVDLTPPCAPTLSITPDCETFKNTLLWNNPNNSCADDVVQYNIYYTSTLGEPLELLQIITAATDTVITYYDLVSIAGCYAITAIDSFQNESVLSDSVCVDNCPIYELPNVFSPDGNNVNDRFIPFPYKFIDKVDMKIFDRWGQLIYETTDPNLGWDGTYHANNQDCSEGVYYYVCNVDLIKLEGIETVSLTGFIHLLRSQTNTK